MSYIGRKPIKILVDTHVEMNNNIISIQGPLGLLEHSINEDVDITINDKEIIVNEPLDVKHKSLWSTTRSLIMNMMVGVTQGHASTLKIVGVGFKAEFFDEKASQLITEFKQKSDHCKLSLKLGYSHPIYWDIPSSIIKFDLYAKGTVLYMQGTDKRALSSFAKEIQGFRPPEPYKGKGVIINDELIRRKEGKKK